MTPRGDAQQPSQAAFEVMLGKALREHAPDPAPDVVLEVRRHAAQLTRDGRGRSSRRLVPPGLRTPVTVTAAALVLIAVVLGVRSLVPDVDRPLPAEDDRSWTTRSLVLGDLGVTVDHPTRWQLRPQAAPSTPYAVPQARAFLSTQVLDVPACDGPRPCGPPVSALTTDGVLATLTWWSLPGAATGPGFADSVSGLPARYDPAPVPPGCPPGTVKGLGVTVRTSSSSAPTFDRLSVTVCAGPRAGDEALPAAQRMIDSLQITAGSGTAP